MATDARTFFERLRFDSMAELAVIGIAGMSMALAVSQVVPIADANSWVDQISRLGMTGLLAVAVIVLWKKVQEKDDLLMTNYKSMAEALAANKATVEKMSETLDGIKEAVERMETVREQMTAKRV